MKETYVPKSLSENDKARQIKSIKEKTLRPFLKSFKSKRSKHVINFEKKYNTYITNDKFIDKNLLRPPGREKILEKGRGAYFSSGSRPNQTPESWARARLASALTGGPAAKYDRKILEKYRISNY